MNSLFQLLTMPLRDVRAVFQTRKDSFIGSSVNIMNSIVGAGVVALPYIMKENGVILGLFVITFGAIVQIYMKYLQFWACNECRRKYGFSPPSSCKLGDISYAVEGQENRIIKTKGEKFNRSMIGSVVYITEKICMMIFVAVALISYQVVMMKSATECFGLIFTNSSFFVVENRWCMTIMGIGIWLFIIGSSLSLSIKKQETLSLGAVVLAYILIIVLVICFFFGVTFPDTTGKMVLLPDMTKLRTYVNLFVYLGVVSYAYTCVSMVGTHGNYKKDQKLTKREETAFSLSILNSHIGIWVLYCSAGLFGYLSFLDSTPDNVILGYHEYRVLSFILRFILFWEVLLTYPIVNRALTIRFFDMVKALVDGFKMGMAKITGKKVNEEKSDEIDDDEDRTIVSDETVVKKKEEENLSPRDRVKKYLEGVKESFTLKNIKKDLKERFSLLNIQIAVIAIACTLIIGILAILVPSMIGWMSYGGSSAGVFICYIHPGLIYLQLRWKHIGWMKRILTILITMFIVLFFGVFCTIFFTMRNLEIL